MKKKLLEQTHTSLKVWCKDIGIKPFHADQIVQWVYEKKITDSTRMTNLSAPLRQTLSENFESGLLDLKRVQESEDKETIKFLWQLEDGKLVESVLIVSDKRRTVCVSSQVGCPARCAFCASGKQGFFRNLETYEIVSQVYQIDQWLKNKGERVSHVVYMGMGEPFRNYEHVVQSIKLLIDDKMLNLSQRRITISTVGVVEGIIRFAEEGLKVNLVLSLHAPNQKIRLKIIPYAREYPLEEILDAMYAYQKRTHRDITFEYILISNINDQPEHALELAKLLQNKQCTVNLIPYNPVAGLRLEKPKPQSVTAFRKVLDMHKIVNTCRYTKGDDIAAACGQLALQCSSD
jgi:23S rRNA (adenine2503-C2)-methyltransferase